MCHSIKFVAMLVLLVITSDITTTAAVPSCNSNVIAPLTPCLSFIKGVAVPAAQCCSGARNLASQVRNEGDRQAVCKCLKGVLTRIGPYDPNRLPLIGPKCGIHVSIPPVDANTNCSGV